MTHEFLHLGNEVDISKSYNEVTLYAVVNGREQKITLSNLDDMDVLHSILDTILGREYERSAMLMPPEYSGSAECGC